MRSAVYAILLLATAQLHGAEPSEIYKGASEANLIVEQGTPAIRGGISGELVQFHVSHTCAGAIGMSTSFIRLKESDNSEISFEAKYDSKAEKLMFVKESGKPLPVAHKFEGSQTRLFVLIGDRCAFLLCTREGPVPIAWEGKFTYRLKLRDAERYRLGKDVTVQFLGKNYTFDQLDKGLTFERLKDLTQLSVSGQSPEGAPFSHRYDFDPKEAEGMVNNGLAALCKWFNQP